MLRKVCQLTLWAAILVASAPAEKIQFEVTTLGPNLFRYDYFISGGFVFQKNDEIDIRFDPNIYDILSNGVAGSDFNVALLQPNNPPGTDGDYSALALVDNAALNGPFSVEFALQGGRQPLLQPFFINQLDSNGKIISTLETGSTAAVPEPSSLSFAFLGTLMISCLSSVRRRTSSGP